MGGQLPTLSRAIKELEQNLGIKIFDRSAKGMFLTPDGEVFIRYAKAILKQVDEVEAAFRRSGTRRQRFSLSCPRASYISDAFTAFSLLFKPSDAMNSETCVAFNITSREQVIVNTWYGGEMKKGMFSMMNYYLPLKGIASMHCSANTDMNGENTAIFFGQSRNSGEIAQFSHCP